MKKKKSSRAKPPKRSQVVDLYSANPKNAQPEQRQRTSRVKSGKPFSNSKRS